MLITLCLMLATLRIKLINTTQIARLVVFSFRVFRFLSLRADCMTAREIWVRLQSYHEGTAHVKTRLFETYKREMRTSLSWMESLSMPYYLVFRRL
jgi:hypothetical protein